MPSQEQQERQTLFWENYIHRDDTESHPSMEKTGNAQFPDALPIPSGYMAPFPTTATFQHPLTPASPLAQTSSPSGAELQVGSHTIRTPQTESVTGTSSFHPSDIDEESEPHDNSSSKARPHESHMGLRDSSPGSSSPDGVFVWNNENLLSFWRLKLRKKGYATMLKHFPGQTIENLRDIWTANKQHCNVLGAKWKAAGKPEGPVSDWLV